MNFQQVIQFSSVQLLSRVQLCYPKDCSTPGFPVHHRLPELAQSHVHRVSDAIQPSHPLSSSSPGERFGKRLWTERSAFSRDRRGGKITENFLGIVTVIFPY